MFIVVCKIFELLHVVICSIFRLSKELIRLHVTRDGSGDMHKDFTGKKKISKVRILIYNADQLRTCGNVLPFSRSLVKLEKLNNG